MSKYFSFLRKKRGPSLHEEEVGGGGGGKRKHNKEGAKKPTSSSSSKKGVDGENNFSVHNLDVYDEPKEDSFHSDSDSVFDNVSFGEVALEGEFEKRGENVTDKIEDDKAASEPEECNSRQINAEGEAGHNACEDGHDGNTDDFMDEAFNDLEDEEEATSELEKEEMDNLPPSCFHEPKEEEEEAASLPEGSTSGQDFVTILPVCFDAEARRKDDNGVHLNENYVKRLHVGAMNIESDKNEISKDETTLVTETSNLSESLLPACSPEEQMPHNTCEPTAEILGNDFHANKSSVSPSSNLTEEISVLHSTDEDKHRNADTAEILNNDSFVDEICKNNCSTSHSSNLTKEITSDHLVEEKGQDEYIKNQSPNETVSKILEISAKERDLETSDHFDSTSDNPSGEENKNLVEESILDTSLNSFQGDLEPSLEVAQHTEKESGSETPEYTSVAETELNNTVNESDEMLLKSDSILSSSDEAECEPKVLPEKEMSLPEGATSGEIEELQLPSSNSESILKSYENEPNTSLEYQDLEMKLELSSVSKEIEVKCNNSESVTHKDQTSGCQLNLQPVDNYITSDKSKCIESSDTSENCEKKLHFDEEIDALSSDNDCADDIVTRSESSSVPFVSCERPSFFPSDLEEDDFDSAREDLSDEEKEVEEKSTLGTSLKSEKTENQELLTLEKDNEQRIEALPSSEKQSDISEIEGPVKCTSDLEAIVKPNVNDLETKTENPTSSIVDIGQEHSRYIDLGVNGIKYGDEDVTEPSGEEDKVNLTQENEELSSERNLESSVSMLESEDPLKTENHISVDEDSPSSVISGLNNDSRFDENDAPIFKTCDKVKSENSSHEVNQNKEEDGELIEKKSPISEATDSTPSSTSPATCDEAKVSNNNKVKDASTFQNISAPENILAEVPQDNSKLANSGNAFESSQTDLLSNKQVNEGESRELLSERATKPCDLLETVSRRNSEISRRISTTVLGDHNEQSEAITRRTHSTSEDNFLINIVKSERLKAEARLAQRRAARAEARELRLRELERQQQDQDNNEEEEQYATANSSFSPPGDKRLTNCASRINSTFYSKAPSRAPSTPRTRSSVPVNSISRRSSEDSTPDDGLPVSARELKADLKELEEKFRKAMITNAQLDNEKATLTFEVEFLKDKYSELEENHMQLTKEHRKKCSENEQLRKLSNKLKEEVKTVRRVLQERDELIQEYGLVLIGEENGDESYEDLDDPERRDDTINDLSPRRIAIKKALLSNEASELLAKGAAKGSLDVRLRKYAEDKNDLEDEVRRLKMELEEELSRRRKENGIDHEKQKEASKSLNEYKFRVQKAEAEVSTLQANVARLESLVARYKASTEQLEQSEEELKSEKRRLQRELRDAQNRLEELELTTSHLQKRFDKLKTARSTLLKDLSQDPA